MIIFIRINRFIGEIPMSLELICNYKLIYLVTKFMNCIYLNSFLPFQQGLEQVFVEFQLRQEDFLLHQHAIKTNFSQDGIEN